MTRHKIYKQLLSYFISTFGKVRIISFFIIAILAFCLYACTRGEGPGDGGAGGGNGGPHVITDQDTIAPVVAIYTPASNQVFSNGTTINISGRITDETGLYQGSVKLVNDATGEVLKNQLYEIHGFKTYDFSLSHSPTVTAASDLTITVSFVDHGLNSATQSVKVKMNP